MLFTSKNFKWKKIFALGNGGVLLPHPSSSFSTVLTINVPIGLHWKVILPRRTTYINISEVKTITDYLKIAKPR